MFCWLTSMESEDSFMNSNDFCYKILLQTYKGIQKQSWTQFVHDISISIPIHR